MKLTIKEAKTMMGRNHGNLALSNTNYTELPDNLVVGGWLDIRGTKITELPDNLTVGGSLDLRDTKITELPDNLTVGDSLFLSGTKITNLPDNLTVGGWLDLRGTKITNLPDNLTVGGWLDLSGSKITELPDNLTVGGSLDLRGTKITNLPNNLTVGGSLDLRGIQITNLPDNLAVGVHIIGFYDDSLNVKYLEDGDYIPGRYLYADGLLTHVTRKKKFQDYDYFVGKIPGHNVLYDGAYYAHCRCIRDGIRDLAYKHASDRGADQYQNISVDQHIPTDELVAMYRVITGACQQGTESFLKSLGKLKDSYTIQEAVHLTEGQYGATGFKEFFGL